jgi:hypothetical protein
MANSRCEEKWSVEAAGAHVHKIQAVGQKPESHRQFADHLLAEYRVKTSMAGSALLEHKPVVKPKPPKISMSAIQRQKMQAKGYRYSPGPATPQEFRHPMDHVQAGGSHLAGEPSLVHRPR